MCLLVWVGSALGQNSVPAGLPVRYTLLEGSYFVDDCLICGRPTIEQPMRGTFDLVLLQETPPYWRYAVQDLDFIAEGLPGLEQHLS